MGAVEDYKFGMTANCIINKSSPRKVEQISGDNTSMAISTLVQKSSDNGVNVVMDERIHAIIDKVKTLDRNKYAKTFECYSILAEYKSFIQNPSSSLDDLNEARTRLNSEFQRAMALAMLE